MNILDQPYKIVLPALLLVTSIISCSRKSSCKAYDDSGPTIFTYAPKTTYSRAVATKGNEIFIGNSDGLIYRLNTRNGKSKVISKQALPELRDIHVIGRKKVLAMQSADTSQMIYLKGIKEKTFFVSYVLDTSISNELISAELLSPWKESAVFLDGMDILPSGSGFMMGDPVNGYFSLYSTSNHGKSWQEILPKLKADEGEAGFAASGTNVQCLNDSTYIFVSGGMRSRFFKTSDHGRNWMFVDLPFHKSQGSGAFSVHFWNENEGVVVGGDYTKPDSKEKTSFYTKDGGKTWVESSIPALGYRSCVIELDGYLFACGTSGIDKSEDGGVTWGRYMTGNYIALVVVDGRVYATIPEGKIIEL